MQDHLNDRNPSLEKLMAIAADAAEAGLRRGEHPGILFLALTGSKGALLLPGLIAEAEFEPYARFVRLKCVAEEARAGVLTMEVRLPIAQPGEQPVPAVRTDNQVPQRHGVLLCGEALGGISHNRFLPIKRDAAGSFTGFGPAESLPPGPMDDRFGRLLPTRAPSAAERQAAAKALAAM